MSKRLKNKYLILAVLTILLGMIPGGLTYAGTSAPSQTGATVKTAQATAAKVSKNETVYAKLAPDGTVTDTTVVNWLHFNKERPAAIEDQTQLSHVKALNASFKVKADSNKVLISDIPRNTTDLFYSGQTNKELPLKVKIDYYLNGQSITPDELAGKSGAVKMVIHLSNQTVNEGINIAEKNIYTPFLSMVSLELPIDKFSNVEAPDGTVTVVGETMKLNWILFPYPDTDAVLTMQAQDFELDSIDIAAVPKMPTLTEVNIEDKLSDLSNGLGEVDQALAQVQTGSQQLAAGQDRMAGGLTKISDGVGKLKILNQVEVKLGNAILSINNELLNGIQALQTQPMVGDMVKPIITGLQKQQVLLTALVNGGQVEGQNVPPLAAAGTGMDELKTGLDQAVQGTYAARAGAQQLNTGVGQVRQQGIRKMQNAVAASLQEVQAGKQQKQELQKLAADYTTFTGTSDSIPSNVQFIIETKPISK